MRRFISHELETRIGRALIGGEVQDGATIRVELVEDDLVVEFENPSSGQLSRWEVVLERMGSIGGLGGDVGTVWLDSGLGASLSLSRRAH